MPERARHESSIPTYDFIDRVSRGCAAVARCFIANDRLGTRNAVIARLNAPRGARFVEAGAKRKVYR